MPFSKAGHTLLVYIFANCLNCKVLQKRLFANMYTNDGSIECHAIKISPQKKNYENEFLPAVFSYSISLL